MKLSYLAATIILTMTSPLSFASQNLQRIVLTVTENGFEPSSVDVKPNTEVELEVTRKTDSTCATQILIQSKKIKTDLPLNKLVKINIGKLEKGEIRFSCGMDMITGVIHIR